MFGGRSGEHSISCIAAGGIMRALDPARFEITPIGITRQGRMVLADPDPASWEIAPDGGFPEVPSTGPEVILPSQAGDTTFRVIRDGRILPLATIDVVFPLLHGPYGEDGTIQGALELLDLPYVGSGVLASATAMDKITAKEHFAASDLPTAPAHAVDARLWNGTPDEVDAATDELDFPLFVKPSRAGSSLGITRVTSPDGLDAAIRHAGTFDPRVIVEAAVTGRELECGVLGARSGERPFASHPGEVRVIAGHDFYDFDAKYRDENAVELICPAQLPEYVSDTIRTMAVEAFEAIGAEGLARVDFFYDPDGPTRPVPYPEILVNEINTMPGFTPFSLYARMFAVEGWPYADLVAELIDLALARPPGLR